MEKGLTTAMVLGYPDPNRPYLIDTEASHVGVGTVLSQVRDREVRVIAY